MKINWKIRLKNKMFWLQVYLSVFVPIVAYAGLSVEDITTWETLIDILTMAVSNPFVLGTAAVGIFNALVDNTTPGISDSKRALRYDSVKDATKE